MKSVIAYQSLNSNSSSEHNLAATTAQYFTRQAHKTLGAKLDEGGSLRYPTNTELDPKIPIQGPAELVGMAEPDYWAGKRAKKRKASDLDDIETPEAKRAKHAQADLLGMTHSKALQIHQLTHGAFHQECDLVVFGELDANHPDWNGISSSAGGLLHVSHQTKACNCFSIHGCSSRVGLLAEDMGWCAVDCRGIIIVFVHVPNSLAANKSKATKFYNDIKNTLDNLGIGVPDVIMGDTNQPRDTFSANVIEQGTEIEFLDAHAPNTEIKPIDLWTPTDTSFTGTNSVDSKKFDVALYNKATIKSMQVKYFSQLSSATELAAAFTDHMGILVSIEKE